MNRIYRLVWSQLANAWVAVAENAKSHGKSSGARKSGAAVLVLLSSGLLLTPLAYAANAADAKMTLGNGSVATIGNTTTINQQSQNIAIDWSKLSTAANEALVFNQPNSSAIALNRITGSSPSTLLGSLTANGQVFILNPNGVLFGAGAQVNVGGLVASTLSMSNADLAAGNMIFAKDANSNASGSVVNQGTINAADGGYVALIGATVRNQGKINARLGTALLAAGNKVTLNLNNGSLLGYSIDQGALNALAENRQLIQANGGQVLMSAKALNNLTTAVVNNTGIIEAKTVQNKAGRIMLMGDMEVGTVNVGGRLDASAANGDGGFVETSAAHVKINSDAIVTTNAASGNSGSWLIDPVDFTIAASGGDITGKALSAQLANNGTVTILNTQGTNGTAGDINVNDAVSWNSNGILVLTASHDININAAVTATGANAGLKLNYGGAYNIKAPITLSGANSSLSINGQAYTLIRSMAQLDALDKNNAVTGAGTAILANGFYALAQDLDAAGTTYTRSLLGTSSSTTFGGTFAGLGHTINNLTINAVGGAGLFALVGATAVIRDLGLVGGNVYGANGDVGALAGRNTGGSINNVYASDVTVGGTTRTGGLVGYLNGGSISNSYASGNVSSSGSYAGGLVGFSSGVINNTYAEGDVSGIYAGGLVGYNNTGAVISQSYATGDVNGIIGGAGSRAGGLVGVNSGGTISYAYATGAVTGDNLVGGLIGMNTGTVSNVYATGNVTLAPNPNIFNSYAGGLIAFDGGTVSNAVWDSASTGKSTYTDANGAATNTTDVSAGTRYNHGNYGALGTWTETASGSGVWVASDAGGNPQWVMIDGSTRPFLYSEWSTQVRNAHQLQLMAANLSAHYTLGKNIDLASATSSNASGMWSTSGFASVGNAQENFTGTLDGSGYKVGNLTIDRSGTDLTGLFGMIGSGSSIHDIGLVGGSVIGGQYTGGLVGYNDGGNISNAYADVDVSGSQYVGGLIGGNNGSVSGTYANGVVSGTSNVGGLIGKNESSVSNSYAGGNASGTDYVGGLVGYNSGSIGNSYAYGNASGSGNAIGGLAGFNSGSVSNVYASGNVSGDTFVGGLLGINNGSLSNGYASGVATGNTAVGGLVGSSNGSITASFWNTDSNSAGLGDGDGSGAIGIDTAQSRLSSTFANAGWDIGTTGGTGTIWRIYDGQSGPLLRSFLKAVTVTTASTSKTYDGTSITAGSYTPVTGVTLDGSLSYVSSKNAGNYSTSDGTLVQTGLYSDQQGYDISYASANLTINKADLTVTATSATKTYNGTTNASGAATVAALAGAAAGDIVGSAGAQAFGDKNAGTGKTVIASGVIIKDATNNDVTDNYNISYIDNTNGVINKANVTLSVADVTKTYDGTVNASGTIVATAGQLFGTDNASATSFTFDNKSAGSNKTVTANGLTVNDGNGGNNYNVSYVDNTASTIDKASLSVIANSASKFYDGIAYNGNNGSTITGFVNGETIADLSGSLNYHGTAQGATGIGNYTITANGLSSANYTVTFVNGALVINPVSLASAAVGATLEQAYNSALQTASGDPGKGDSKNDNDMQLAILALQENRKRIVDPSQLTPRLSLAGCGVQLPATFDGAGCR